MRRKLRWLTLSALSLGSATLFNGCLGAFWDGLWNTGWPTDSRWINLAVDMVKEATIYSP